MSDSDFSDVDDDLAPSTVSSSSSASGAVTVGIASAALKANKRLEPIWINFGGALYPCTSIVTPQSGNGAMAVLVLRRDQPKRKPVAADVRQEYLLRIAPFDLDGSAEASAFSESSVIEIDVMKEDATDEPRAFSSKDGMFSVAALWTIGDQPSHPKFKKGSNAPAAAPAAPAMTPTSHSDKFVKATVSNASPVGLLPKKDASTEFLPKKASEATTKGDEPHVVKAPLEPRPPITSARKEESIVISRQEIAPASGKSASAQIGTVVLDQSNSLKVKHDAEPNATVAASQPPPSSNRAATSTTQIASPSSSAAATSVLNLQVVRAYGLINQDTFGDMEVFAELHRVPSSIGGGSTIPTLVHKSNVVGYSTSQGSCTWDGEKDNAIATIKDDEKEVFGGGAGAGLMLMLWDEDMMANDFLGQVLLTASSLSGDKGTSDLALVPRLKEPDQMVASAATLGRVEVRWWRGPKAESAQQEPPIPSPRSTNGDQKSKAVKHSKPRDNSRNFSQSSLEPCVEAELVSVSNIKVLGTIPPDTYVIVDVAGNCPTTTQVVKRRVNAFFNTPLPLTRRDDGSAVAIAAFLEQCSGKFPVSVKLFERRIAGEDKLIGEGRTTIDLFSIFDKKSSGSGVISAIQSLFTSSGRPTTIEELLQVPHSRKIGIKLSPNGETCQIRLSVMSAATRSSMVEERASMLAERIPRGTVLQLEVMKVLSEKQFLPVGSYFAGIQLGTAVKERTQTVLNEASNPCWFQKFLIPLSTQLSLLTLSVVRSVGQQKEETTLAMGGVEIFGGVGTGLEWISLRLPLQAAAPPPPPPSAGGATTGTHPATPTSVDQSASTEVIGSAWIRYRVCSEQQITHESSQLLAKYRSPLESIQQHDSSAGDGHDHPRMTSLYSLSLRVERGEDLLLHYGREQNPDCQLILAFSGDQRVSSRVVPVDLANPSVALFQTSLTMEPRYRFQQFTARVIVPSSKAKTVLGEAVFDIAIRGDEEVKDKVIMANLEPRDGPDKERAIDVAVLNRAGRHSFGRLFVTYSIDRLDFPAASSLLQLQSLRVQRDPLVPTSDEASGSKSKSTATSVTPNSQSSAAVVALWFAASSALEHCGEPVSPVFVDVVSSPASAGDDKQLGDRIILPCRASAGGPLCMALLPPGGSSDRQMALEKVRSAVRRLRADAGQAILQRPDDGRTLSTDEINASVDLFVRHKILAAVEDYIELDLSSTIPQPTSPDEAEVGRAASSAISGCVRANMNYVINLSAKWMRTGREPVPSLAREGSMRHSSPKKGQQMTGSSNSPLRRENSVSGRLQNAPSELSLATNRLTAPFQERLWTAKVSCTAAMSVKVSSGGSVSAGPQEWRLPLDGHMSVSATAKPVVSALGQGNDDDDNSDGHHSDPSSQVPSEDITGKVVLDSAQAGHLLSHPPGVASFTLFLFGDAYTTRTDLSLTQGTKSCHVRMDMMTRSGKQLVPPSWEGDSPLLVEWAHGTLGVTQKEEQQRRAVQETAWRRRQKDIHSPKVVVTFTVQTCGANSVEPPRVSGATLTRCLHGGAAILIGGLSELSVPSAAIYKYVVSDHEWHELAPPSGISEEVDMSATARRLSATSLAASAIKNPPGAVFPPRHGHSAAYSPGEGVIYIYGGIGPGGFELSEGFGQQRKAKRGSNSRRVQLRHGYLNDLWALHVKDNTLKKVETTCHSSVLQRNGGVDVHDFRFRHCASMSQEGMVVIGGKTIMVTSTTVDPRRRAGGNSELDGGELQNTSSTRVDASQNQTSLLDRTGGGGGASSSMTMYEVSETICGCSSVLLFNPATREWKLRETTGYAPAPRYGHASVALRNKLYVFGGRGGTALFNDLFALDLETFVWEEILPYGPVIPPPMDLATLDVAMVDGTQCLILAGGRQPSEQFRSFTFSLSMQFWRELPFHCDRGERRQAPAMCVVDDEQSRQLHSAASSTLKRLPSQTKPLVKLLLVGGERGLPPPALEGDSQMDSATVKSETVALLREEAAMFDATNLYPRPCAKNCVVNIARDPSEIPVQVSVGAQLLAASGSRRSQQSGDFESRLQLKGKVEPGWQIEKAVKRLHASHDKKSASSARVEKKARRLAPEEQGISLERIYYDDLAKRQDSRAFMMRSADEEFRQQCEGWQPLIGVWRAFYDGHRDQFAERSLDLCGVHNTMRELRFLELNRSSGQYECIDKHHCLPRRQKEPAKDLLPERQLKPKLASAQEQEAANKQLYYDAMKAKREYQIQLEDHILRGAPSPRKQKQEKQRIDDQISDDDDDHDCLQPNQNTSSHGRPQSANTSHRHNDGPTQRPQSAAQRASSSSSMRKSSPPKVGKLRIVQCIERLHRGPPSPLSSQKFAQQKAMMLQAASGGGGGDRKRHL